MSRNYEHREFTDVAFQELALGLGRVALSWNDFHISLSGLFSSILKIPNRLIADRIWYAVKSDRSQREMLRALNSSPAIGLNLTKVVRSEIDWILGRADALENLRNDLLHSPFVNSSGEIASLHSGANSRAMSLEGKNLLAECKWFYETAILLRDHADKIDDALIRPGGALPKRPRPPERPVIKKK